MAGEETVHQELRREPGTRPRPAAPDSPNVVQDVPKRPVVASDMIIEDEKDNSDEVKMHPVLAEVEPPPDEVIPHKPPQRHGCVEMRKGIPIKNDAGEVIGYTEQWRCQCDPNMVFRGRTPADTERLYLNHIRSVDPKVPKR